VSRAALSLPPVERDPLRTFACQSRWPEQKEIDKALAEEVERRCREIDEGKVELIDGELLMARLSARFKT
jgi:hypothetical protein